MSGVAHNGSGPPSPEDTAVRNSPIPPESPTYATKIWEKEPLSSLELAAVEESAENEQRTVKADLEELKKGEIELEHNAGKGHDVNEEASIKEVEEEQT